jgi:hypothetical protein
VDLGIEGVHTRAGPSGSVLDVKEDLGHVGGGLMEGPEGKEGGLIAIEGRGEGSRRERRERWGCQLQASGEHCCWRGRIRVKSVTDGLCAVR